MAKRRELGFELREIIDFPVKRDAGLPVQARHRLMPGRADVDDAESPLREAAASVRIDPDARIIRSAVRHFVCDRAHEGLDFRPAEFPREIDETCNSTHVQILRLTA